MAVLDEVEVALEGLPGAEWQKALALSLAESMDKSPNASTAKELRALMTELGAEVPAADKDVSDDLAAKRAARRASAS